MNLFTSEKSKGIVAAISILVDVYTNVIGTNSSFTHIRTFFAFLIIAWIFIPISIKKPSLWYASVFLGILLLIASAWSLLAVYYNATHFKEFTYTENILVGIVYLVGGAICITPDKEY